MNKAIRDPATVERFKQLGVTVAGGSADAFHQQITSEYRNWAEIAREANIKAE